jgi:aminoglycoside phosphotransferase (APT) family kinase protein
VGWRRDRARAVVHLRGNPGGAGVVAKVMLRSSDARADIRREALALDSLSAAARKAGASVPTGRVVEQSRECPALLLEALPGTSAAAILTERRTAYEGIVRRLGAWLEAWSRATCRARRLDQAVLDAWVLEPARRLADRLDDGTTYAAWLESRCRELVGCSVPLVATHNDLTMSNVLLQPDGRLGILDWEAATAEGLPLRDYVYAVVDATAARDGYRDRPGALSRCFGAGSQGVVAEALRRLRRAIDVPDGFATIAFHACWLQHAEDEARKRAPGEPLPFLGCVQRATRIRDLA